MFVTGNSEKFRVPEERHVIIKSGLKPEFLFLLFHDLKVVAIK